MADPIPGGVHASLNGDTGPLAQETIDEYRQRLMQAAQRARTFIEENPGTALVGAAAIGFLFARFIRRRS